MNKLLMVEIRQAVLTAIIDYDHTDDLTSEGLEAILNRTAVQIERSISGEKKSDDCGCGLLQ